jgi:hypothetical protein
MILMTWQQATSPGFHTPRHPRKYLPIRQQMSFRGRGRQLAGKIMMMVFFTAKKLIGFDVLPRDSTFNQLYFINNIFTDLKTANLNFRRQKTGLTFSVHMDRSMCHDGSKVHQKLRRTSFSECHTRPIRQI